jgi:AraC-like DNA-binding protein
MQITTVFQFIAAFNFLLISVLIWYLKDKVSLPIKVFSFFLIGKGITLLSNLIFITDGYNANILYTNIATVLSSFLFFYAPFLYLFAAAIVGKKIKTKEKIFHFLPFVIFFILNVTAVLVQNLPDIFNDLANFSHKYSRLYYFQVIGYTTWAYLTLKNNAKEESIVSRNISKWLLRVLFFFILVWILFIGVYISGQYFNNIQLSNYFKFLGVFSLLILSTITLLMSLKNPEVFFNNLSIKLSKVDAINKTITKANFLKLSAVMVEKKMYKNADLKVSDLSEVTGLSSRNISAIIKKFNASNFYDFINYYRIEESKKMLENDTDESTILTILYEAGFNSKSVFNTVFKKMVGVTPSEYRKNHLSIKYS